MKKYLVIDFDNNFSSVCDTENEVFESVGYEVGECEFEELVENIRGEYEIIEITSENNFDIKWL